jgi:hypothetical protein
MSEDVVRCYSGYTYAGHPREFYWNQAQYEVESIQAEWQSPDGKHFLVIALDGSTFELIYDGARDSWKIQQA